MALCDYCREAAASMQLIGPERLRRVFSDQVPMRTNESAEHAVEFVTAPDTGIVLEDSFQLAQLNGQLTLHGCRGEGVYCLPVSLRIARNAMRYIRPRLEDLLTRLEETTPRSTPIELLRVRLALLKFQLGIQVLYSPADEELGIDYFSLFDQVGAIRQLMTEIAALDTRMRHYFCRGIAVCVDGWLEYDLRQLERIRPRLAWFDSLNLS